MSRLIGIYNRMVGLLGLLCLGWVLVACIRDELEVCSPLRLSLEVTDKNYLNSAAAARLGLEEARSTDLPFKEYVGNLAYRVTCQATGQVVAERTLSAVTGDEQRIEVSLPEDLPYGTYILSAWGNLGEQQASEGECLELHPQALEGTDTYYTIDTLHYALGTEQYVCGLKRTKGKLIISTERMPDAYAYTEWQISDIMSRLMPNWTYADPLSLSFGQSWVRDAKPMVSKTLLAPSSAPGASLLRLRYYVGDTAENNDSWIAPEVVCVTMRRNELTILRYEYDPCCCRFKIFIFINDNWETLHIMDIE